MIKLISVDLDGTLLNEKGAIDSDLPGSLAAVQDRGVTVVVNTGRDYRSASRIARAAGITGGMICCNGSCGYDGEGRILFDHPLPVDVVKKVEGMLAWEGFTLSYFTRGGQFMLLNLKEYQNYFREELMPLILSHEGSIKDAIAEVENWWQEQQFCRREYLEKEKIYKLNAVWHQKEEAAARVVKQMQSMEGVTIACTNMGDMEITMPGVDKGSGLLEYAKAQGIQLSETMVIGDSENDLPAMELPGVCSVAMGSAKEVIRSRCKYCTAGKAEGGVKKVLDGLIKQMDRGEE